MSSAPERDSEQIAHDRRQVFRAAGLVGVLALVSRMAGLLREIFIRQNLGVTSIDATAFDIASRFPETIFLIIAGGAIGSAFIPTFTAYFARDDERGAWRLFSAVINLVLIATTLASVLVMIFADPIVEFFYAENIAAQPELLAETVYLLRIMLLSPIIFGASGVIMAALNARQHFLLPALAPTLYNLGIIAGGWVGSRTALGITTGLAVGTVLGALFHLLIQLPGLRRQHARYSPILTLRDPGVRQVLWLMAPRVLGLSFSEINKYIILFLTGSMPLGSLPALNAAFRLLIMPQGILGQALGIAAFPTLAALAAQSAIREMRQILSDSLRLLLFLGLPATVLLMMLAQPIVAILFERGLFDAEATELVSWALLFYAVGLVALTAIEVIARSFYALNDTLTPVLVGGLQILSMWVLSLWLRDSVFPALGWLPLGGLALGFSISNILEMSVLLLLLRRKMGGINGRQLASGFWRMGLAAALMALAIVPVLRHTSEQSIWIRAIAGTAAGGAVYLLACWLLRVEEWQRLSGMALQRLRR
ncbi:MAG: murein biosynthesis integral membrane protein MurJ [Chloroflexota bacterium]